MVAWFRLFSPVYWALFLREGGGHTHWGRLVCSLANIALSFNKESLLFLLEGITKECKSSSAASRYCFCNLLQLLISQNELIMICHVFKIKRHSATFEVRWLLSFFFIKKDAQWNLKVSVSSYKRCFCEYLHMPTRVLASRAFVSPSNENKRIIAAHVWWTFNISVSSHELLCSKPSKSQPISLARLKHG